MVYGKRLDRKTKGSDDYEQVSCFTVGTVEPYIHRFGTNNLWGYPLVEAGKPFEGDSGEVTIDVGLRKNAKKLGNRR